VIEPVAAVVLARSLPPDPTTVATVWFLVGFVSGVSALVLAERLASGLRSALARGESA